MSAPDTKAEALTLLEWHAAADDNHDAMEILRWVRAILAERDALRERCERLEKALRHIAFEPLCGGRPEATHAQCLDDATRIARAALSEVQP